MRCPPAPLPWPALPSACQLRRCCGHCATASAAATAATVPLPVRLPVLLLPLASCCCLVVTLGACTAALLLQAVFKEVVPIASPQLRAKIHQTYR